MRLWEPVGYALAIVLTLVGVQYEPRVSISITALAAIIAIGSVYLQER